MAYLELTKRTLEGIYLVTITEVEEGKTSNGYKQITFSFTILDAPHKEDVGQTINFQSFYLEGKDGPNQIGINQLMDFICTVTGNPPAKSGEVLGFDTDDLVNQRVTIRVVPETYTAKKDGTEKVALRMKESFPASAYDDLASAPF